MAVVTELVTKFTFKGSIKPLQEFNLSLGKSVKLLAGAALGLGLGGFALDKFVLGTLKAAEGQRRLSLDTGVAIEKIQELGYAASVSGSDAQALESSLISLSGKIGQAVQTGSMDFARLGIAVRDAFGNVKSADKVLEEVAARFKQMNLSLPQQQNFASALGIDISLIQLLNKSGAEIDKLRKKARELGVVTQKQSLQINEFNNSVTTLKFGLSALRTNIAVGLSPALKEVTEKFTNWLIVNKDLIRDGVQALAKFIGDLWGGIKRLATFIGDIIESTVGWKVALIALGVYLAITLAPIYLITAAIIAVLAIIDDLIVAFKGGKSVIRDFFLEFFGFDITPVLQELVAGFINAVAIIKQVFVDLFSWISTAIKFIANVIENSFAFKAIKGIAGLFGNQGTPSSAGNPQDMIPSKQSFVPDYKNSPTSNSNEINQNVNIEIKSTDPVAAGQSVQDTLQNQLQNAYAQLNKGGR